MSTIKFACPKCKQYLEGDESMGGDAVDCPFCHTQIMVALGQREQSIPQ